MRNFLSKFGMVISMGAALLLGLAYLAPLVPPDKFWPLAFFGLAYPLILLLNTFLLITLAIFRSKKFLIPLIAILIGLNHLNAFVRIFPKTEHQTKGINIVSYNVHNFESDRKRGKNNQSLIVNFLKECNADIICLQEATLTPGSRFTPASLKAALPNIKHYQLAHGSSFSGPVTLTRFTIINMGEIRFGNSSNLVLFSDIKISENQIIRVYNCHFQSNMIAPQKYSLIDSEQDQLNRKQIGEAKELGLKLRKAFKIRAEQARAVARHIQKTKYPVVVCGDFNDTHVSFTYNTVKGDLIDAFRSSGSGISNTYNGIAPFLRIDYILHDKSYQSVNYQQHRVKYSDHFPVTCKLLLE